MLAYAFQVLKNEGYAKLSFEDFDNVEDLLSAILVKGISNQVKRGICKNYISTTDLLNSPKGKINIAYSIKANTVKNRQLICEFDDFSENVILNQILKSTATYLSRSSNVKEKQKKELKKVLVYFKNVSTINLTTIQWHNIRYQKNNATYKMLINICYLATQEMILKEDDNGNDFSKPVDEQKMYRLYEKFILEYYRKHYTQLCPQASYIKWSTDDNVIEFLPTMKSDITLTYNNKTLIIDAKYYARSMQENKMYNKKTLHSNNLYQIFTYVKNKDATHSGSVSGMLLYAKTDEDITPNNDYKMSGNPIFVRTLDLNQAFSDIAQQLDLIIYQWLGVEISKTP